MNAPIINGLTFIGEYSNPHVNAGQPLPLYDFAPRADGKPDINTVEGWNRMCHDFAARSLRKQSGREPDEAEIQAELERNTAEARNIIKQCRADRKNEEENIL
jgi:hypothetical protein